MTTIVPTPGIVAVVPAAYSVPPIENLVILKVLFSASVSFVNTLPVAGKSSGLETTSATATGAVLKGSTKICNVAVAQVDGVPPQTWYTISTVPVKFAFGVNVYVPSALNTSVPCALIGPLTKLAVNAFPLFKMPELLSFVNTDPVTVGVPLVFPNILT